MPKFKLCSIKKLFKLKVVIININNKRSSMNDFKALKKTSKSFVNKEIKCESKLIKGC